MEALPGCMRPSILRSSADSRKVVRSALLTLVWPRYINSMMEFMSLKFTPFRYSTRLEAAFCWKIFLKKLLEAPRIAL